MPALTAISISNTQTVRICLKIVSVTANRARPLPTATPVILTYLHTEPLAGSPRWVICRREFGFVSPSEETGLERSRESASPFTEVIEHTNLYTPRQSRKKLRARMDRENKS